MSTDTVHHPAVRPRDVERPGGDHGSSRTGIGRIVAGSMAAGLAVAVALVAAPFIPARAHLQTGVVLLGFAVGWALLAVLSVRFSDHPQRWAVAPAVFLAVAGLVSLLGPDTVVGPGFRWVSPGGILAVIGWLIASGAFALYVANFGSYNKTYGSLGGVIVFLTWLWISNIMILLGAEFNAELERERAIQGGMQPEDREPFAEPRDTRKMDEPKTT